MITSGEGGTPAAEWGHRSVGVGALIDLIHQRPAPHTFDHKRGSVKAPTLMPDNDDDEGGLGFWRWQSMLLRIVAWGAAIMLLALTGIVAGMISLRLFL